MPKIKRFISIFTITAILIIVTTTALHYLAKTPTDKLTKALSKNNIQNLLDSNIGLLWSEKFDHYQNGLLKDVALSITELSRDNPLNDPLKVSQLDKLSYYLRIYSSFGKEKDWQQGTAKALNQALLDLQNVTSFYQITPQTARLHENYAVALYQLYFLKPLQQYTHTQIKPLTKLINLYAQADSSVFKQNSTNNNAIDYALWEILRASAILPYRAYSKDNKALIAAVTKGDILEQALLNFAKSFNATRITPSSKTKMINNDLFISEKNQRRWPQQHAFWALANLYNVYNKQYWHEYDLQNKAEQQKLDNDEISLSIETKMEQLDNAIWQILSKDKTLTFADKKQQFSIPYVVTTFRGRSECEEGSLKNRCVTPAIAQALPIKHICSDSLYILTQQMTTTQLNETCHKLTSQEDHFHQILATHRQAVANDNNDKLRVVIFNDASQYNIYGQLLFDISTNNGGMYIEGTPQDPDNIGTFYSYEHFWARPKFAVWNLNHEYVHYLDGRFIKYDTYGHFADSLVWWSEGLAEYISKGNDNVKAFTLLHETKQDKWPSLAEVFATEYKEGTDKVYKWGYLAVRFMSEKHHNEYLKLAHFLKTDFFAGYKKSLTLYGKNFQQEFSDWLTVHNENFVVQQELTNVHKPRTFSHYAYKTYLQPVHLTENKQHMLWQYWHDNERSSKK